MNRIRLGALVWLLAAACIHDAGQGSEAAAPTPGAAVVPQDVEGLVEAMRRAERLTLRAFNTFGEDHTSEEPRLITGDPQRIERFVRATELRPIEDPRVDPAVLSVCGGHYVELDLDDGGRITLENETWGGGLYVLVTATGWAEPIWFRWNTWTVRDFAPFTHDPDGGADGEGPGTPRVGR
jgi:hypothetical protein